MTAVWYSLHSDRDESNRCDDPVLSPGYTACRWSVEPHPSDAHDKLLGRRTERSTEFRRRFEDDSKTQRRKVSEIDYVVIETFHKYICVSIFSARVNQGAEIIVERDDRVLSLQTVITRHSNGARIKNGSGSAPWKSSWSIIRGLFESFISLVLIADTTTTRNKNSKSHIVIRRIFGIK